MEPANAIHGCVRLITRSVGNTLAIRYVERGLAMGADMQSEECRERAAACAALVELAGDVVSKVSLRKAEEAWLRMAAEIDAEKRNEAERPIPK